MKYTVTSETPLWIKETPSLTGKNIGLVHKDDVLNVLSEINGYIRTDRGYILKNLDNLSLVAELTTFAPVMTATVPLLTATDAAVNADDEQYEEWNDFNYTPPKTNVSMGDFKRTQQNQEGSGKIVNSKKNESTTNATTTATEKSNSPSTMDITVVHLDQLMKDDSIKSKLVFNNIQGIYGMPYQWLSHVDPRVINTSNTDSSDDSKPGRIYSERIIAKMPLLLISPGKARYNATGDMSIADILSKEFKVGTAQLQEDLQKNSGIFYSFDYANMEYFQYVNPILRMASRLLNIENRTLTPASGGRAVKLSEFDWSTNYNASIHGQDPRKDWTSTIGTEVNGTTVDKKTETDAIHSISDSLKANSTFVGTRSLAFYVDTEYSASDSMSNSPRQSSLAGQVNSVSDTVQDMRFLLGFGSAMMGTRYDAAKAISETSKNITEDLLKKNSNGDQPSRLLTNLLGTASSLMEGGKMMFPSIWGDSSFGRTYNVKIKLVSPDYDTYSWYMNILVPLVHLICLTLPQKSSDSYSYITPFLVRAFYKGMFNCDLGLITGLNITRGAESCWTQSGLPTIVDVDLSIQDMYEGLAMSKSDAGGLNGAFAILKNPIYLDYIANICGVNLNEPDVRRLISFYKILAVGAISDTPKYIMGQIEQMIGNWAIHAYGRIQT